MSDQNTTLFIPKRSHLERLTKKQLLRNYKSIFKIKNKKRKIYLMSKPKKTLIETIIKIKTTTQRYNNKQINKTRKAKWSKHYNKQEKIKAKKRLNQQKDIMRNERNRIIYRNQSKKSMLIVSKLTDDITLKQPRCKACHNTDSFIINSHKKKPPSTILNIDHTWTKSGTTREIKNMYKGLFSERTQDVFIWILKNHNTSKGKQLIKKELRILCSICNIVIFRDNFISHNTKIFCVFCKKPHGPKKLRQKKRKEVI